MVDRSSGSRPGSTSSSALDELRRSGFDCRSVEPIAQQGWASWTYVVDGRFVARFPRNDDIVAAMHREMRLLPALAAHVSFRVPLPVHATDEWFVYELIRGRGFEVGDDVASAMSAIDELHSFPVDEARLLLDPPSWHDRWASTFSLFESVAFPHLPRDLVERVVAAWPFEPPERETLVHDDLGLEHLIVDEDRRVVGMIDFEDATVGDPQVDLVPLVHACGMPATERMWRFRWNGALHAVVHHVWEDEPAEIEAAIAELRRRLDAGPRR